MVIAAGGEFAISTGSAGCSPKEDAPRNGVNDVRKACELRAAWTRAAERKCMDCVAAAPSPPCDCSEFKEFGGLCRSQDDARRSEPSCVDSIGDCTRACKPKDCACVEGCYSKAEACKVRAAAEDGCVDVCDPQCK